MKISNVIFRQTQNGHTKFQNATSFSSPKPKMTMENSNVIFSTDAENDHGKFERHFQTNSKLPQKIPTSFSSLNPKMNMGNVQQTVNHLIYLYPVQSQFSSGPTLLVGISLYPTKL